MGHRAGDALAEWAGVMVAGTAVELSGDQCVGKWRRPSRCGGKIVWRRCDEGRMSAGMGLDTAKDECGWHGENGVDGAEINRVYYGHGLFH